MIDFRGRPACSCQVTWIPAYEHELQRRGIITGLIPIAQLIGGAPQSGGTHLGGGVSDFWLLGATAERGVWVARQMGADATWHRLPGWDGPGSPEHVHSVLRGCPHLSASARAQIGAVDLNGDGIGGTLTPDPGPRPLSGRTWQQGIAWARQQEEDDMPSPKDWTQDDWTAFAEFMAKDVSPGIIRGVWQWSGFDNLGTKAKALLYGAGKDKLPPVK